MNNTLRQAILATLSVSALLAYSGHASATATLEYSAPSGAPVLPVLTEGTADVVSGQTVPKRAWSDYSTTQKPNNNYGWTHTAGFAAFQVGSAADILAGKRFDVTVDLNNQTSLTNPLNFPGFSIWTSGTDPVAAGTANGSGYGHAWSQVRGPNDGGVADSPCTLGGDCSLGSNGWLGASGGGNIISGHNGWIGYANAGYSFVNGDGDFVQGLYAGYGNTSNIGQYATVAGDPLSGTALTNVNSSSPYVNGGFATLSAGDAKLTLNGLAAGYYLIGLAGSCPSVNKNGQNCASGAEQGYTLTIANNGVSAVTAAVPEPEQWAMLLLGLPLLSAASRSRRKHDA